MTEQFGRMLLPAGGGCLWIPKICCIWAVRCVHSDAMLIMAGKCCLGDSRQGTLSSSRRILPLREMI